MHVCRYVHVCVEGSPQSSPHSGEMPKSFVINLSSWRLIDKTSGKKKKKDKYKQPFFKLVSSSNPTWKTIAK